MDHLVLTFKAYRIRNKLLLYQRQKENSIRAEGGEPPVLTWRDKYFHFVSRTRKKVRRACFLCCPPNSRIYNFGARLRRDGTFENFILKSFIGFLGGILLTYIFFMFFVFQLNFTLSSATVICFLLGLLLSIGLAFSHKVRCFTFLLLPVFFSKRGRQALMAYAFILALTGPAKNTLHNMGVLSESLACGQEQLKQAAQQIVNMIKQPFYAIRDAIRNIMVTVKKIIAKIKEALLTIQRIVLGILNVIKTAIQWLGSVVNICNKKVGTPFQRCMRVMDAAVLDCQAKLGPLWSWLCSVAYIGHALCYLVKFLDFICMLFDFIGDIGSAVVQRIKRKLREFMRHIRSIFFVSIDFTHSFHFETNQSQTMQDVTSGMITEIKHKTDRFLMLFDWMSFAFSFFFIFILFRVWHYRHKFLTSDSFDNHYIRKDFRLLDLRRAKMDQETVLPLNHRERRKYIRISSLRLVQAERTKLAKSFVFLGVTSVKLLIHLLTDYCLYWVLAKIRYYGRFQTAMPPPNMINVHVEGTGVLSDMYRSTVKAFSPMGGQTQGMDTMPCLPDPLPPNKGRYIQIVSLIAMCWVLAIVEPYGLRIRNVIMSFYHPNRAQQRTVWLYNNIIRARGNFLKFSRRLLRRVAKGREGEGPQDKVTFMEKMRAVCPLLTRLGLLGKSHEEACLLCGNVARENDAEQLIHCSRPGCIGVYCKECFADLQNICTICMEPIEYGDPSDMSFEKDSSDEANGRRYGRRKSPGFLERRITRGGDDVEKRLLDSSTEGSSSNLSFGYQTEVLEHRPDDSSYEQSFRDIEKQPQRDLASVQDLREAKRRDLVEEGEDSATPLSKRWRHLKLGRHIRWRRSQKDNEGKSQKWRLRRKKSRLLQEDEEKPTSVFRKFMSNVLKRKGRKEGEDTESSTSDEQRGLLTASSGEPDTEVGTDSDNPSSPDRYEYSAEHNGGNASRQHLPRQPEPVVANYALPMYNSRHSLQNNQPTTTASAPVGSRYAMPSYEHRQSQQTMHSGTTPHSKTIVSGHGSLTYENTPYVQSEYYDKTTPFTNPIPSALANHEDGRSILSKKNDQTSSRLNEIWENDHASFISVDSRPLFGETQKETSIKQAPIRVGHVSFIPERNRTILDYSSISLTPENQWTNISTDNYQVSSDHQQVGNDGPLVSRDDWPPPTPTQTSNQQPRHEASNEYLTRPPELPEYDDIQQVETNDESSNSMDNDDPDVVWFVRRTKRAREGAVKSQQRMKENMGGALAAAMAHYAHEHETKVKKTTQQEEMPSRDRKEGKAFDAPSPGILKGTSNAYYMSRSVDTFSREPNLGRSSKEHDGGGSYDEHQTTVVGGGTPRVYNQYNMSVHVQNPFVNASIPVREQDMISTTQSVQDSSWQELDSRIRDLSLQPKAATNIRQVREKFKTINKAWSLDQESPESKRRCVNSTRRDTNTQTEGNRSVTTQEYKRKDQDDGTEITCIKEQDYTGHVFQTREGKTEGKTIGEVEYLKSASDGMKRMHATGEQWPTAFKAKDSDKPEDPKIERNTTPDMFGPAKPITSKQILHHIQSKLPVKAGREVGHLDKRKTGDALDIKESIGFPMDGGSRQQNRWPKTLSPGQQNKKFQSFKHELSLDVAVSYSSVMDELKSFLPWGPDRAGNSKVVNKSDDESSDSSSYGQRRRYARGDRSSSSEHSSDEPPDETRSWTQLPIVRPKTKGCNSKRRPGSLDGYLPSGSSDSEGGFKSMRKSKELEALQRKMAQSKIKHPRKPSSWMLNMVKTIQEGLSHGKADESRNTVKGTENIEMKHFLPVTSTRDERNMTNPTQQCSKENQDVRGVGSKIGNAGMAAGVKKTQPRVAASTLAPPKLVEHAKQREENTFGYDAIKEEVKLNVASVAKSLAKLFSPMMTKLNTPQTHVVLQTPGTGQKMQTSPKIGYKTEFDQPYGEILPETSKCSQYPLARPSQQDGDAPTKPPPTRYWEKSNGSGRSTDERQYSENDWSSAEESSWTESESFSTNTFNEGKNDAKSINTYTTYESKDDKYQRRPLTSEEYQSTTVDEWGSDTQTSDYPEVIPPVRHTVSAMTPINSHKATNNAKRRRSTIGTRSPMISKTHKVKNTKSSFAEALTKKKTVQQNSNQIKGCDRLSSNKLSTQECHVSTEKKSDQYRQEYSSYRPPFSSTRPPVGSGTTFTPTSLQYRETLPTTRQAYDFPNEADYTSSNESYTTYYSDNEFSTSDVSSRHTRTERDENIEHNKEVPIHNLFTSRRGYETSETPDYESSPPSDKSTSPNNNTRSPTDLYDTPYTTDLERTRLAMTVGPTYRACTVPSHTEEIPSPTTSSHDDDVTYDVTDDEASTSDTGFSHIKAGTSTVTVPCQMIETSRDTQRHQYGARPSCAGSTLFEGPVSSQTQPLHQADYESSDDYYNTSDSEATVENVFPLRKPVSCPLPITPYTASHVSIPMSSIANENRVKSHAAKDSTELTFSGNTPVKTQLHSLIPVRTTRLQNSECSPWMNLPETSKTEAHDSRLDARPSIGEMVGTDSSSLHGRVQLSTSGAQLLHDNRREQTEGDMLVIPSTSHTRMEPSTLQSSTSFHDNSPDIRERTDRRDKPVIPSVLLEPSKPDAPPSRPVPGRRPTELKMFPFQAHPGYSDMLVELRSQLRRTRGPPSGRTHDPPELLPPPRGLEAREDRAEACVQISSSGEVCDNRVYQESDHSHHGYIPRATTGASQEVDDNNDQTDLRPDNAQQSGNRGLHFLSMLRQTKRDLRKVPDPSEKTSLRDRHSQRNIVEGSDYDALHSHGHGQNNEQYGTTKYVSPHESTIAETKTSEQFNQSQRDHVSELQQAGPIGEHREHQSGSRDDRTNMMTSSREQARTSSTTHTIIQREQVDDSLGQMDTIPGNWRRTSAEHELIPSTQEQHRIQGRSGSGIYTQHIQHQQPTHTDEIPDKTAAAVPGNCGRQTADREQVWQIQEQQQQQHTESRTTTSTPIHKHQSSHSHGRQEKLTIIPGNCKRLRTPGNEQVEAMQAQQYITQSRSDTHSSVHKHQSAQSDERPDQLTPICGNCRRRRMGKEQVEAIEKKQPYTTQSKPITCTSVHKHRSSHSDDRQDQLAPICGNCRMRRTADKARIQLTQEQQQQQQHITQRRSDTSSPVHTHQPPHSDDRQNKTAMTGNSSQHTAGNEQQQRPPISYVTCSPIEKYSTIDSKQSRDRGKDQIRSKQQQRPTLEKYARDYTPPLRSYSSDDLDVETFNNAVQRTDNTFVALKESLEYRMSPTPLQTITEEERSSTRSSRTPQTTTSTEEDHYLESSTPDLWLHARRSR